MREYIIDFFSLTDNQRCIMLIFIAFFSWVLGGGMAAGTINAQWEEKVKKDYMTKEEVVALFKDNHGIKKANALQLCLLEREVKVNEYKH